MIEIIRNNQGEHIQHFVTVINIWANQEIQAKCNDTFSRYRDYSSILNEITNEMLSKFLNHPIFNSEYNIPLPIQYLFLAFLINEIEYTFVESRQEQELKPIWWNDKILARFNLEQLLNIHLSFFTIEPNEAAISDFIKICTTSDDGQKCHVNGTASLYVYEIMQIIEELALKKSYTKGLYFWLNKLEINPELAAKFGDIDYSNQLIPICKGNNYFSLPGWNTQLMVEALKTNICSTNDSIIKKIIYLIQAQQPTIQPKQLLKQTKLLMDQISQHPFFNTEHSFSSWLQLSFAIYLLKNQNIRPIWWNQYVIVELLQLSPSFLELPFSFFSKKPLQEVIAQFNACLKDTLAMPQNWFNSSAKDKKEKRNQLGVMATHGNYFGERLMRIQIKPLLMDGGDCYQGASAYIDEFYKEVFLKSMYDIVWQKARSSGKRYQDYLEIENSFIELIKQISEHPFIKFQFPLPFKYFFLMYLKNLLPTNAIIDEHYFYLLCCHKTIDELNVPGFAEYLESLSSLFVVSMNKEEYSEEIIKKAEQFCKEIQNFYATTPAHFNQSFMEVIGRIKEKTKQEENIYTIGKEDISCQTSLFDLGSSFVSEQMATTQQQLGWNCFDVAAGISRMELVKFALDNASSEEFRQLLSPEIKQAAVLTAVYLNNKEKDLTDKISENVIELSSLARMFKDIPFIQDRLNALATLRGVLSSNKSNSTELLQNTLPESMHTDALQIMVNSYLKAYEDMRDTVSTCNDLMDLTPRLSLPELDEFFKSPTNQTVYTEAYFIFTQNREDIYTKHEAALDAYCRNIEIYKQYVQNYYGQKKWFCFQMSFTQDRTNTSMVDIVAKMLEATIVIYQNDQEIYRTNSYGSKVIEVIYNGTNHFIKKPTQEKLQLTEHTKENTPLRFMPLSTSKALQPESLKYSSLDDAFKQLLEISQVWELFLCLWKYNQDKQEQSLLFIKYYILSCMLTRMTNPSDKKNFTVILLKMDDKEWKRIIDPNFGSGSLLDEVLSKLPEINQDEIFKNYLTKAIDALSSIKNPNNEPIVLPTSQGSNISFKILFTSSNEKELLLKHILQVTNHFMAIDGFDKLHTVIELKTPVTFCYQSNFNQPETQEQYKKFLTACERVLGKSSLAYQFFNLQAKLVQSSCISSSLVATTKESQVSIIKNWLQLIYFFIKNKNEILKELQEQQPTIHTELLSLISTEKLASPSPRP